jgi:hypothetical protein
MPAERREHSRAAALLSGGFLLLLLFGALHLTGISAALLFAYWTAKTVAHALGL